MTPANSDPRPETVGGRVLVCGGRDFDDDKFLADVLDYCAPTVVIHGAARGADSLADAWAHLNGVAVESYPADWRTYGRAAGPIRNVHMLANGKPDLVVAFPGGNGTAHMVKIARAKKVRVLEPTRLMRPTNTKGDQPQ